MNPKQYLGDSVYATYEGGGEVVLTTENGREASNTIVLEAKVMTQLIEMYGLWVEAEKLNQPST